MSRLHQFADVTRTALAAVLAAERTASTTAAPVASAQINRNKIAGRITEKLAERAAIADARAAGDHHPDHAGLVAIIDMDVAALETHLVDAENVLSAAMKADDSAKRAASAARTERDQCQGAEKAAQLIDYLAALDKAATEAVQKLGDELAKFDAARAIEAVGVAVSHIERQQAAMVGTITMVADVRRRLGVNLPMWKCALGFDGAVRCLRTQLRMQ
jgi:hypothetical protein